MQTSNAIIGLSMQRKGSWVVWKAYNSLKHSSAKQKTCHTSSESHNCDSERERERGTEAHTGIRARTRLTRARACAQYLNLKLL